MREDKSGREERMVREAYNFTSTKQKNSMSRIEGDFYVPKEPDF